MDGGTGVETIGCVIGIGGGGAGVEIGGDMVEEFGKGGISECGGVELSIGGVRIG